MRGDLNGALRHFAWAISAARTHYAAQTVLISHITCAGMLSTSRGRSGVLLQSSRHLNCLHMIPAGCFRRQFSRLVDESNERVLLENRQTGREVHMLGVAHASEQSAEAVRALIDEVQPQLVVLPLCTMRYLAMRQNKPLLPEEVLVRPRLIACPVHTASPASCKLCLAALR